MQILAKNSLRMIAAVLLALELLPLKAFAAVGEPFYIGNAIQYADTNDSLYLSDPISNQTDNITMEVWVKPDNLSAGGNNIRIMYSGHSSGHCYRTE